MLIVVLFLLSVTELLKRTACVSILVYILIWDMEEQVMKSTCYSWCLWISRVLYSICHWEFFQHPHYVYHTQGSQIFNQLFTEHVTLCGSHPQTLAEQLLSYTKDAGDFIEQLFMLHVDDNIQMYNKTNAGYETLYWAMMKNPLSHVILGGQSPCLHLSIYYRCVS